MLEMIENPHSIILFACVIGMIIFSFKRKMEEKNKYIVCCQENNIKIKPSTLMFIKTHKHYFYYSAKSTRNKRIFLKKKKRENDKIYFDLIDKIP